jgi:hypothetical protein
MKDLIENRVEALKTNKKPFVFDFDDKLMEDFDIDLKTPDLEIAENFNITNASLWNINMT